MEHLTEALDRLGVKTCAACGKTGAKSLCLGCRSVSYCGKACQKVAWPAHKRECRRIVREKKEALARIRDPIEAACAADEAMAADACRPNIPAGAECYICGNDKYWKGELVRSCSCRGPHAGFVHIRCLVQNAEVKGEEGDEAHFKALKTCSQCLQEFRGPVMVPLWRAAWLRYMGRAETDELRQAALFNLGSTLSNSLRHDEALSIYEEVAATRRRLYRPDDERRLESAEGVAIAKRAQGGAENLQSALKTLTRVYNLRIQKYGLFHELTLYSASHSADAQRLLGMLVESIQLRRRVLTGRRRVFGENHALTLECEAILAETLARQGELDEAREIRDRLWPIVTRILGPDHKIANILRRLWVIGLRTRNL